MYSSFPSTEQMYQTAEDLARDTQQATGIPWWGWLLIILGAIVLLVIVIIIIVYAVQAQNSYGCVPGKGCVDGEGSMSETLCKQRCAEEGATVFRCQEDGNCVQVSEGEGNPDADVCSSDCRQGFQLFAQNVAPASNVNSVSVLSVQGLCQYGNDIYTGFDQADLGYRLQLLSAPATGGLKGEGASSSNGNEEEPLPLETKIRLVRFFEDAPYEVWGNLALKSPQFTLESLRSSNPFLAEVPEEVLEKYQQWALEGSSGGATWTIEPAGDPSSGQVHLSTTVDGEKYYLYLLQASEEACDYLPVFALPIDPTDPPEGIPPSLLNLSVFLLDPN